MGLLNELNTINRTLENNYSKTNTIKQLNNLTKERIKKLMRSNLEELYSQTKNKQELENLTKDIILHKTTNMSRIEEQFQDRYKEKMTHDDIDYLDENYLKFILEAKKEYDFIYNSEEKSKQEQQKEEERKQKQYIKLQKEETKRIKIEQKELEKQYIKKQQEKQIAIQNIFEFIRILTLVIMAPFIFLFIMVYEICKNTK